MYKDVLKGVENVIVEGLTQNILSFFQCVLLTYASIATIALFFKLKPKKEKAVTAS